MAAPVGPLPQLRLAAGPAATTAEQRYWRTFGNALLVPSATGYAVTHLSWAGDAVAVTTGARVHIYSSRTRKLVKTMTRFGDVARGAELRADARVLAAGDDGGRIQVFDMGSRAVLRTWEQHRLPVWATRWSPAAPATLLSAGDDAALRLWDLTADEPTATLRGHDDYVRCARFMPASVAGLVVSGSYDATVRLWDPRIGGGGGGKGGGVGGAVMTFKHAAPVEDVLPLPSGTTLLAAAGSAVSVLDLVAARPLRLLANHQKTVTSLALASGGRRVVTGGLEGHVKVFETGGWNVVDSAKYPSPVLSVLVVPAGAAPDAPDGHLAVGMQSGVLSLRTRLTGADAARDRDRDREMAALLGGRGAAVDAARARRRRQRRGARGADADADADEPADVVIADADADDKSRRRRARERPWHRHLRHARYARALDAVVDRADAAYSPLDALALVLALRHRGAVRDALEARDEARVLPVLAWVCAHMCDPRYVGVCVELALHLHDLYAHHAAASADLAAAFRVLARRVKREVESAQLAVKTGGMLDTLVMGAVR